jgi:perosamine synthetase
VVTTDDSVLAARMRQFRNHGIATDHRERERQGAWTYDMTELGFNYRLSDLQCALGTSQLHKLPGWLERRRVLAARYDALLPAVSGLTLVHRRPDVEHAYHLYVVQCEPERLTGGRDALIAGLRAEGIGATIHYPPVHLHGFYRARFGTAEGLCPVAEAAAGRVVTLPLFPAMDEADVDHVVERLRMVLDRLAA